MANVNLTFVNIYSSKIKYITLASNYRKTLTRNTQFYLFGLNLKVTKFYQKMKLRRGFLSLAAVTLVTLVWNGNTHIIKLIKV